jgi:hypothetical protein
MALDIIRARRAAGRVAEHHLGDIAIDPGARHLRPRASSAAPFSES